MQEERNEMQAGMDVSEMDEETQWGGENHMWWFDGLSIDGPRGVPPQFWAAKAGGAPSPRVSICLFVFQELSL